MIYINELPDKGLHGCNSTYLLQHAVCRDYYLFNTLQSW